MSKKKFREKKEKKHKDERKSLRQEMLELFDQNPGRGYDFKQIARKISLKKKALNKDLFALLEELEEDGRIKQLPNGSFTSTKKPETLSGKVDHVNPRFAYIVTGIPGMKDIYVRTRDLGTAVHGDVVEVELFSKSTGENPEGEVVAVTQRARNRFVGRLELSRGFGFVVPDFKKIYQDFFIYPESLGKAVTNDKVVVEVVRWSEGDKNPEAKIVERLRSIPLWLSLICHSVSRRKCFWNQRPFLKKFLLQRLKSEGTFAKYSPSQLTRQMQKILTMPFLFRSWKMAMLKSAYTLLMLRIM
jgi:ribonuclease R